MSETEEFSIDFARDVLRALERYAQLSGRSPAAIVGDAVVEYLARQRARPEMMRAFEEALAEHDDLLRRLAK